MVDVLAKAAGAASPYLMGAQFTAADVIIGSGLRWGMMFKLLPERPEFKAYVGPPQRAPRAQAGDGEGRQAGEGAGGVVAGALGPGFRFPRIPG